MPAITYNTKLCFTNVSILYLRCLSYVQPLFSSLLIMFKFQFSIWDATHMAKRCPYCKTKFQFSIWDAVNLSTRHRQSPHAATGFNSLFEMRRDEEFIEGEPSPYVRFNSLFEMPIFSLTFLHAYSSTCFNSLFEMLASAACRYFRTVSYSVSILYLRCGMSFFAPYVDKPEECFNSLFEMRRLPSSHVH